MIEPFRPAPSVLPWQSELTLAQLVGCAGKLGEELLHHRRRQSKAMDRTVRPRRRHSFRAFFALPPRAGQSEPKRPVGPWQSYRRPIRLDQCSLDQLGRGLQDQIGTVVDLVEALDYPVMQKQKARGSVKSGSPFAISIQWFKTHNSIYSKRSGSDGYRRSDRSCRRHRHMAVSHTQMAYSATATVEAHCTFSFW
ncbi:hypothetical protein [Mesorhizobium sp. WSM3224]|uniref:hypothetical protein n=1 Tax=Mesorhizobium sp. WSM3224 TaxID=1040986 RepID=UPI0012EBAA45|nr:hypothetical protein [Mesorhizobium sp. WSM3224]